MGRITISSERFVYISLKPGLIEYSEFLLPFELFFRDVKREDLSNEDMYLITLGWSTQHKPHTKTFLGIEIHLKI